MHHQTSSGCLGATIFRTQTSKTFLKKACTAKHANTTPSGNRFEAKASPFQKVTQEKKGPKAAAYKQAKPLRV